MYRNRSMIRLQHCAPGRAFYEQTTSSASTRGFVHPMPASWSSTRFGPWTVFHPHDGSALPRQGWKIHISTHPGTAHETLRLVADICVERRVPFKHLSDEAELQRTSNKYANRGSAGMFITVFPRTDEEFCELLPLFDMALRGFDGPYILSDVKFGESPVYFRYGAFFMDRLDYADGSTGYAIQAPDGQKVHDNRAAVFTLPAFVEPPDLIRALVEERLNPAPGELEELLHPYVVRSSLHFSNAGGVYLADSDRGRFVLKEARRWSAFSSDSTDATERLRNEHSALTALAHVGAVVDAVDYRVLGDHEFLIEEYIPGVTVQAWVASNYPFSTDPTGLSAYAVRALPLAQQMVAALTQIHDAGWSVLDLQPKNILIDGNRVRLIDMEAARPLEASAVGSIGTPGFVPHVRTSNRDRDRYALAAVVLHLFSPSLAGSFDPSVLTYRARKVAEQFPADVSELVNALVDAVPVDAVATSHPFRHAAGSALVPANRLVDQVCNGIEWSRRDGHRRYPGDATQFADGAGALLNIETGAAGVMLMLARAGRDVTEDRNWLSARLRDTDHIPFHGLLRGSAGIASVFAELGDADTAEVILLAGASSPDPGADLSVRSGLSGTVLALCDLAGDRDGVARSLLDRCAASLAARITGAADIVSPQSETGNAIGLFDGWVGVGLACRRLAEVTGDDSWEHLMDICFHRELAQLTTADSGALRVDYSRVSYGYLSEGAAGIAFALAQCAPARYRDEIARLTQAVDGLISMNGGLFRGTAGVACALLPVSASGGERARLMTFTADSFLFCGDDPETRMVLGDNGHHLSADFSTGAAGYVGALLSQLEEDPNRWFPVTLPTPIDDDIERGEHNERIAFFAGPVERVRA
ncbi:class III lanthionine synthetase LanKC [Microbacterium azadirachtae]